MNTVDDYVQLYGERYREPIINAIDWLNRAKQFESSDRDRFIEHLIIAASRC